MKVLKCSQCWLPREANTSVCRKCQTNSSEKLFRESLSKLSLQKPLDYSLLKKSLTKKQVNSLILEAIVRNHPLQENVKLVWQDILHEIRFHKEPHSTTCKAFRNLLDKELFHEILIPEECCECMYTCVTKAYSLYSNLAIGHLFYSDKEKLITIFQRHLKTKGGRESLLNYINFMLWISNSQEHMTPTASRRVIDMLLEAVDIHHPTSKDWILEELVMRPENYQFFLSSPPCIPGNYTETMFDYFTDFDVWWNFWQRVNTSIRKKIEFRDVALKGELFPVTWEAERIRDWCLDIETLSSVNTHFSRRL